MFENVKPKWYIGIGALSITIIFFIFGAWPLQQRFGMWGLAITELGILIIALLPIFLFKWKLRDVMPIKKVTLRQLFAILLLVIFTYIIGALVAIITTCVFPDSAETSAGMAEFFATVPFVFSILIASVMPGICEEVLHRGLILHTLRNCKNETMIMVAMAVMFGIFHLDFYRFLPTAIAGFVLTYIMIKAGNFLLPVLYHAAVNAVAVAASHGADATQAVSVPLNAIGVLLVISAISPFLFYLGARLLNKDKPGKNSKYAAIALTLILPIFGIGIIALSDTSTRAPVADFSFTEQVNNKTPPTVLENIVVETKGVYVLSVSIRDKTNTIMTIVKVEHEDGEIVLDVGGGEFFTSPRAAMKAGNYKATFAFETQSEQMIPVEISFAIK